MNKTPVNTPRKESQTPNWTPIKLSDTPRTSPILIQQMKASEPPQSGQSLWSTALKLQQFVYVFTAIIFFALYMVRNDHKSIYGGGSIVAFVLFVICMMVRCLFGRRLKTD
jgi:hypothetical protein